MSLSEKLIGGLAFLVSKGKRRYVFFSPKHLKTQLIYDKKNKKIVLASVRNKEDLAMLKQIYRNNNYDIDRLNRSEELYFFYKKILKENKVPLVIDCGGNIGYASKFFSENYPEAKIVCIEPDLQNINQARNNIISKNVDFLHNAIGSINGMGNILDPGGGNAAYQISPDSNGKIEIITINNVLSKYDEVLYQPFIIKIDIEGFESNLFYDQTSWIEKFPLLIIELHDWMLPRSANSGNFLRAIAPLNRDFLYINENVFSISNKLL
jgi:FkbM family methyltransferase